MNYYNTGSPAQYAQHQQSRKDRQVSQLLQMMMQMKQFKQGGKQWEQEQALEREQFELSKKRQAATEKYNEYLMKPKPPTPSSMMQTIDWMVATGIAPNRQAAFPMYKGLKTEERLRMEARARAEEKARATPPKKTTLSTYDKRIARLQNLLDDKKISQETFDRRAAGLKPKPTKEELIAKGLPIREKNETFVKSTFKVVREKGGAELIGRDKVKDAPGAFPTVDGIRIDMPFKYGVAVKNIKDGIGNTEDRNIVNSYDIMLDMVRNQIIPLWGGGKRNYLKFKAANPPPVMEAQWKKLPPEERPTIKFDYAQAKIWFEIYK
jgi:hypothetical protein